VLFEVDIEPLQQGSLPRASLIPEVPAVIRDIAVWVPEEVPAARVLEEIERFASANLAPRGGRVLVTAEDGTKLPFDQEMIPRHFWKPSDPVADRKKALVDFWEKNINRPPIVKMA